MVRFFPLSLLTFVRGESQDIITNCDTHHTHTHQDWPSNVNILRLNLGWFKAFTQRSSSSFSIDLKLLIILAFDPCSPPWPDSQDRWQQRPQQEFIPYHHQLCWQWQTCDVSRFKSRNSQVERKVSSLKAQCNMSDITLVARGRQTLLSWKSSKYYTTII